MTKMGLKGKLAAAPNQVKPAKGSSVAKSAYRAATPLHDKTTTLDLTSEQHKQLKLAALTNDTTMAELLRAAIDWMLEDEKVLAHLVKRGKGA